MSDLINEKQGNLPLSLIQKWIVENQMSDAELGKLLRGFYWNNIKTHKK